MNRQLTQDLQDPLIAVGRVGRPHGVQGEVRAWPSDMESDTMAVVEEVYIGHDGQEREAFRVRSCKASNRFMILALHGVRSRRDAERLKGADIFVRQSALPDLEDPDDFYHFELIGLRVLNADETPLGVVHRIFDNGTQDILIIHDTQGEWEYMVPFVDELVEIFEDEEERDTWVVVHPPEGLLEATRTRVKAPQKQGETS